MPRSWWRSAASAAAFARAARRELSESAALLVDEVLPPVPIRQWVLSVPFALRYLFARDPKAMSAALLIAYRTIAGFQIRKAGLRRRQGECGAVTLIQRFGSALNLNVHFHMLVPDGVYVRTASGFHFKPLAGPTPAELQALVQRLAERVGRHLERRGILVRDSENSLLALEPDADEDALPGLQGFSITYRIALGPQQGRKAFMLQTLAPRSEERCEEAVAQVHGFSLHAGVAARADERAKLERLCRYISRPAVSTQRLSITAKGHIRYALKTPYRDGTTHVVLEPLDFMARLAALIPRPRVNLTRYHGVFAPHHGLRARIVPGRPAVCAAVGQGSGVTRAGAMGWSRRLKRVFARSASAAADR
jgi:hypothetical protein